MRFALSICLASVVLAGPVRGGPNAGGGIVVHTNDLYSYSAGTRCTTPYVQDLASCDDVVTRTDLQAPVLWLLAVFPPISTPRVAAVSCTISYDAQIWVDDFWLCAPPGSLELADPDWPGSGSTTQIAFGQTIVGDKIFPFYGFLAWNDAGSGIFQTETYGSYFMDDSAPPVQDPCTIFGGVGWYEEGFAHCGGGAPGACCISSLCFVVTEVECNIQAGDFMGYGAPCEPSPCIPSGAREEDSGAQTVTFDLESSNPSSGSIRYSILLRQRAHVCLQLFEPSGRWVEDLLSRDLEAGPHAFTWLPPSGMRLASGTYSLCLQARVAPDGPTGANGVGTSEYAKPVALVRKLVVLK